MTTDRSALLTPESLSGLKSKTVRIEVRTWPRARSIVCEMEDGGGDTS